MKNRDLPFIWDALLLLAVLFVFIAKTASQHIASADDLSRDEGAVQRLQFQYGLSLSQITDLLAIAPREDSEPQLARWPDTTIHVAILAGEGTPLQLIERLIDGMGKLSELARMRSVACIEFVAQTNGKDLHAKDGQKDCLVGREDIIVVVEPSASESGSLIKAVHHELPAQTKEAERFWTDAAAVAEVKKNATNCGGHIDVDKNTSAFRKAFAFLHVGLPNDPSNYRLADCPLHLPYLMLGVLPVRNDSRAVFAPELLTLLYSPRLHIGMPRSLVALKIQE